MVKAIIIEDDPMVAAINKKYLSKNESIEVVKTFSNGADALTYLKNYPVDLVLLDVYMPQISGIELLRTIRKERILVDVIMITAANDIKSVDIALKLGIIDYLIKPFDFARFQQAIQKYFIKRNLVSQKADSVISQSDLDQILHQSPVLEHADLEKGLQQKTLDIIQNFLKKHRGEYFSTDELAQRVGFSRVTVQRYLNYLDSKKIVKSTVNYETKGRPGIKYMMP